MPDRSFLDWPFFEDRHRALAEELESWASAHLPVDHGDVDGACVSLVAALGEAGFLQHSGGDALDVRSLCLIRETLARHDGLADFAFAMQGLGMGAVSLFGSAEQRQWLEKTRAGKALSAFVPNLKARGRALWKSLHVVVGFWMSLLLVVFLISGLSWAGVWGGMLVQAWSSFPAEKWDNVPSEGMDIALI